MVWVLHSPSFGRVRHRTRPHHLRLSSLLYKKMSKVIIFFHEIFVKNTKKSQFNFFLVKLHNKSKMVKGSKHWLLFQFLGNFLTIFFNDVYFHEIFLHLFIYLWKRAWHCWLPRSTECQLPKWPASSVKNRNKKKKSGNEDVFSYMVTFFFFCSEKKYRISIKRKKCLCTPHVLSK